MSFFGYDHGEDELMERETRNEFTLSRLFWFGVLFTLLSIGVIVASCDEALAEDKVDMHAIMRIESHGDVHAFNQQSGARGLYQVTPIVVEEWNAFHPNQEFKNEDMFNASICEFVAKWYLNKRIPQMLRYFKKPVSVRNILISYNAGINYVVKDKQLPKETVDYIKKYNKEINV